MNDTDHTKRAFPTAEPDSTTRRPAQRVVIAVGLPGAGKSTWFAKRGISPLSSDQLRLLLADDENEQTFQDEIFRVMHDLLRSRLKIGRPDTYLDATNTVRDFRRDFIEIAQAHDCLVEALYFDVPVEICIRRNAGRSRQVPESIMRAMAEQFDPPRIGEGFHRILVIGEDGDTVNELTA